jgi:hypothetical protein
MVGGNPASVDQPPTLSPVGSEGNIPCIRASIVALAVAAQLQATPLTPGQLARVERGEPVQVLEAVADSPWPRSTVYQFIEATPEQCAAVLSDYALQSSYIPKLNTSRVLAVHGKDTDVEYVINIPIYPDERSVSRQRVVASGDEYRVEWHTVVDSTAKGSVTIGSATFRPMVNKLTGKTGTLMIHDQRVSPASMFGRVPMVRNKAVEASRDAAAAIRRQVEHEVTRDPSRLRAQMAAMQPMIVR